MWRSDSRASTPSSIFILIFMHSIHIKINNLFMEGTKMMDITRMSKQQAAQFVAQAQNNGIQVVSNKFSILIPSPKVRVGERLFGILYIFDGKKYVNVCEKDGIDRRYIMLSNDFVVTANTANNMFEIYVENNPNNLMNKLKPEYRNDEYRFQLNDGISLLMSQTRIFAVSKTGYMRQIDKAPGLGNYGVVQNPSFKSLYTIYKNHEAMMVVNENLDKMKIS